MESQFTFLEVDLYILDFSLCGKSFFSLTHILLQKDLKSRNPRIQRMAHRIVHFLQDLSESMQKLKKTLLVPYLYTYTHNKIKPTTQRKNSKYFSSHFGAVLLRLRIQRSKSLHIIRRVLNLLTDLNSIQKRHSHRLQNSPIHQFLSSIDFRHQGHIQAP